MHNYKFLEEGHIYSTEDDVPMISVSAFTDKFKPEVDWESIAKNKAKKLSKLGTPTTKEQLLEKWAYKRDRSAEIGTLFHTIKENQLLQENEEFYNQPCSSIGSVYKGAYKHSIPLQLLNNHVYPELMICDEDYMLCGQSDKVIVVNQRINVWDYKTDEKIDFVGFSNEWQAPRKMLPPLSHLDDCKANLYSIKMSLYMYLIWKANKGTLKPGELIIEHVKLKRDEDGIPVLENGIPVMLGRPKKIQLPYLKKEVMAMLKTLR